MLAARILCYFDRMEKVARRRSIVAIQHKPGDHSGAGITLGSVEGLRPDALESSKIRFAIESGKVNGSATRNTP